jgi:hypothetical protein
MIAFENFTTRKSVRLKNFDRDWLIDLVLVMVGVLAVQRKIPKQ